MPYEVPEAVLLLLFFAIIHFSLAFDKRSEAKDANKLAPPSPLCYVVTLQHFSPYARHQILVYQARGII